MRLTNKKEADAQRKAYERRREQGYPRNITEERFLKLAAYEDTGFEPEQIAEYLNATDEYVKASEEGRLIVLPCKVGDTVYRVCHEYKQGNPFIKAVTFSQHNFWRIVFGGEIGKTVFLTREEAEAALKGEA